MANIEMMDIDNNGTKRPRSNTHGDYGNGSNNRIPGHAMVKVIDAPKLNDIDNKSLLKWEKERKRYEDDLNSKDMSDCKISYKASVDINLLPVLVQVYGEDDDEGEAAVENII